MVGVVSPGIGAIGSTSTAVAADCLPFVEVLINGQGEQAVAPPMGSTAGDELAFMIDAGFQGEECDILTNSPPQLLGAWLREPLTTVGASFRYMVTYVDVDDDPPASIVAYFDGTIAQTMTALGPADQDYTDGVEYAAWFGTQIVRGVVVPHGLAGEHFARIEASDGLADAQPVVVQGPRLNNVHAGSLILPNPSNRFFIQPVANGPTLTPPAEALPPLGLLAPDADGQYSEMFPIDAEAAARGAQWSVGTASFLRLANYGLLEGEPGRSSGFDVAGLAATDVRAHVGEQAVNLAAARTDGDETGTVRAFPNSQTYRFALVSFVFAHVNWTGSADAPLGVWLELDGDGDGAAELCVGKTLEVEAGTGWSEIEINRSTPLRVFDGSCGEEHPRQVAQDHFSTLNELQDDATLGLMPISALRISGPSGAWLQANAAPDDAMLVDSLRLSTGIANTDGDVDACLYGPGPAGESGPPQPLGCESDIGPNSGAVPPNATHANVWAHQMLPAFDTETFVPDRPYMEPLAYGFHYTKRVHKGPAFDLPGIPTASIGLWPDDDGDGAPDPGAPPLWHSGPLSPGPTHSASFSIPFAGPDALVRYVVVFETGRDQESVLHPLTVQRFVNDAPSASLDATKAGARGAVTFQLGASDADDAQGDVAQRLGGLATWRIEFGDHRETSVGGDFPMPDYVEFTYRRTGTYEAVLTVEDGDGAMAESGVLLEFRRKADRPDRPDRSDRSDRSDG